MRPRGRRILRTAAIGGAGYMVGSSRAKGAAREQEQNKQIAELQAQQAAAQQQAQPVQAAPPTTAPAPPPAAGMSMDEKMAQLKQLGELKNSGILTEAEFEVQKAKILAS